MKYVRSSRGSYDKEPNIISKDIEDVVQQFLYYNNDKVEMQEKDITLDITSLVIFILKQRTNIADLKQKNKELEGRLDKIEKRLWIKKPKPKYDGLGAAGFAL